MKKEEILNFARKNWVPVLRDKSADFLCKLVKDKQPKRILEIGTCIGYSGILMLENTKDSFLITIEKDFEKAKVAEENFKQAKLESRVRVVNMDAGEFIKELEINSERFDFIFLDGPKGQYLNYLPTLKKLLNIEGILVADDVFYHGLVNGGYPKHKHRTIVFRLREFLENIKNDKDFETIILDIEDGISISTLKSKENT